MTFINKFIIKPSPSFETELRNIYNYIKFNLKNPMAANNFYKKIIKEIKTLHYFPERYSKILIFENSDRNLRKFTINQYVIIYEVNKNTRTSFYLTYFS